jgi:putative ABC transport system ATP-binding protein
VTALRRAPALELLDVRRRYADGEISPDEEAERVEALAGVDLTVHRGELVAICGPSGSGKSTLLHLAGALDTPTSGTVRVAGTDVAALDATGRARLRNHAVGFVFQAHNLVAGLSVAENVALPAALARRPARPTRQRVAELLDLVGLAAKSDRRPGQLSGGEQQRVAVARALVMDPDLVLADEPTGNLDSRSGAAVTDLLLAAHHAGRTVVIVTHDQRLAAQAERVIHLRDGRITHETAPATVRERELRDLLDTSPG